VKSFIAEKSPRVYSEPNHVFSRRSLLAVGTGNATTKNVQWLYPENLLGCGHGL
jgi:hypothetical protein